MRNVLYGAVFGVILVLSQVSTVFAVPVEPVYNSWTGSGPFATGLGNKVITALAASPDGTTLYAGTGSGTVFAFISDSDNDGTPDRTDNCPSAANSNQANADGDLLGDACDTDDDNDRILDIIDRTPLTPGYFPAPVVTLQSAAAAGTLVDDDIATPRTTRPATEGDELAAFDSAGILCGHTIVATPGQYSLTVYGDDPATTDVDEGANPDEVLSLVFWDGQRQKELPVRVQNPGGSRATPVWNNGGNSALNLHALAQSRIGTFQIFGNGLAAWFRDADHNGSWTPEAGGGIDQDSGFFGTHAMIPVSGDWNNDGFAEIGAYEVGWWYMDVNGNGLWDGVGPGLDRTAHFGTHAMIPVSGDWNNDGFAEIGAYEDGWWYMDVNGNGLWNGEAGGDLRMYFGTWAMTPVVGDWNGDGLPECGAYEAGQWYIDTNRNGVWDGEAGGDLLFTFGNASMKPAAGDWNGDGVSEIGTYENGAWYLDANGNGMWDGEPGDIFVPAFGITGDKPVIGVWK